MTRRLPQSVAYTVQFKVFLASDHVSPATGKTVAITLSKAGGAFGNPAAGASNATELTGGWYKFALGTGDTDTLGDLVLVGTGSLCDTADIIMQVVSATTGGASNLDASVNAVKTQTDKLAFTVTNQVDANVLDWKSATAPAMTGDAYARLGTPAGASVSADIVTLQADTDDIQARLPTALVGGRIDANVGSANTIARGTVTSGATATSVPTSAFTPAGAAADQFSGRAILFDATTTTTALRGCARTISASTNAATPTLTVGTLPATPVSGDTFSVI